MNIEETIKHDEVYNTIREEIVEEFNDDLSYIRLLEVDENLFRAEYFIKVGLLDTSTRFILANHNKDDRTLEIFKHNGTNFVSVKSLAI